MMSDMAVTGPWLIAGHLLGMVASFSILIICVSAGLWLLQRLGINGIEGAGRVALASAAGLGIVATAILVGGLMFGVTWLSMGAVLCSVCWFCRWQISEAALVFRRSLNEAVVVPGPLWLRVVSVAAFSALVLVLWGLALEPPVDWDSLAYHLQVPQAWLASGQIFLPPDNFHTAFVDLEHMLYLPLLAVGSTAGPAILNALLALLTGIATYALGRELYGRRAGVVSQWLLWTNPLVLLVATTPRVDVTLMLYWVVALLAIVKALPGDGPRRLFHLAAACVGWALGVKYIALAFIPGLLAVLIIVSRRLASAGRKHAVTLLIGSIATGLLAAAPWLLKNWHLIGSPFYPFWSRLRVEPWLVSMYGSRYVPQELVQAIASPLAQIRADFNLFDLFFRPWRLMVDPGNQYSAPTLALWLLPLGVLLPRKRVAAFLVVPALLFVAVVLLQSRETNLRYLLPALPPLLIVVAAVIDHATRLSGRGGSVLVAILLATLLAPTAVAVAARVRESPTLAYLTGRASRLDYLEHYWESGSYMPVVEWANEHLPKSSMTLALFEPRKFYLDVPMRGDVAVRNWPLVEPFAHAPGCLRDAGITHVLVNDAAVEFYEARGMHLDAMHWDRFEHYRADCLELMLDTGVFRYFRVKGQLGKADSSIGTPGN